MRDAMELQIAASSVRDAIPKDKPLEERVMFAMRYVRKHERDVFWMSGRVTEEMMMRTALAAIMMEGSEDDKGVITRSLAPLRALSATMSGVPVDFGAIDMENILPLTKLWNDSAA